MDAQVILYTMNFLKEVCPLICMLESYGNRHIYFYQSKKKLPNMQKF